jgi:hypothetical protein
MSLNQLKWVKECNTNRKVADVNWESTLSLHHEEVTTCLPAGRFTESQIVAVLQKAEQGQKIADLCREPA